MGRDGKGETVWDRTAGRKGVEDQREEPLCWRHILPSPWCTEPGAGGKPDFDLYEGNPSGGGSVCPSVICFPLSKFSLGRKSHPALKTLVSFHQEAKVFI